MRSPQVVAMRTCAASIAGIAVLAAAFGAGLAAWLAEAGREGAVGDLEAAAAAAEPDA